MLTPPRLWLTYSLKTIHTIPSRSGDGFASLKSPLSVSLSRWVMLGEAVGDGPFHVLGDCRVTIRVPCGAEARAGHCWRQYERHFGGAASVREAA